MTEDPLIIGPYPDEAIRPATGAVRPPPRTRDWAQPAQDEEPILDAARVSLDAIRQNRSAPAALVLFLWLRVVRPLLVTVFWIGVFAYSWRHFFKPTENLNDYHLLLVYGAIILGIFFIMLLMGPWRREAQQTEARNYMIRRSSTAELAEFAALGSQRVSRWQRARRLLAHHDRKGRLRHAADLDTGLAAATPDGAAAVRVPVMGPPRPEEQ
ncbi:poly-beta-1,6-N-acetyl-D-glucosamine biosynthesis protein PgaD [Pigmentiphaga aceris]|uniref:Poly-beta-1,6-N-acetyl-D-glucosamine biosynthesis protein PgaD n=1 Tax=Pigmentiphaga aceris TaxID=1940612 RepID=A0A5C0B0P4_9BURK|nr:PgaD family protein [Pigmentiphaga aceris]QEI07526.1 poly-beta-1,6-N-acetyl-D-glucosamine biosynthesis protein PgaD [Pigmentiphaga aceris]